MQKESIGKIVGLILVVIMFLMVFIKPDMSEVAISKDAHFYVRFIFHFFHVSILHFFLNAWCFLSLLFYFRLGFDKLILAYIIASFSPIVWDMPTIGFSAVCYALMGIVSLSVPKKTRFIFWICSSIAVGAIFPAVNWKIHMWAYSVGLFYAFLTEPICKMK